MHSHLSKRARKRAAKWRLAQWIKLHYGCVDCGYAAHAVALQFDHLGDKRMNVSDMIRSDYSWESIKEEIAKCQVRCANCHSVITAHRKSENLYLQTLSSDHQPSYAVNDSLEEEACSADEVWQVLLASCGSLQ